MLLRGTKCFASKHRQVSASQAQIVTSMCFINNLMLMHIATHVAPSIIKIDAGCALTSSILFLWFPSQTLHYLMFNFAEWRVLYLWKTKSVPCMGNVSHLDVVFECFMIHFCKYIHPKEIIYRTVIVSFTVTLHVSHHYPLLNIVLTFFCGRNLAAHKDVLFSQLK